MKKIITALLVILILIGSVPLGAHAADRHLIDGAGLLTEDEAAQVEEKLAEASDLVGVDVLLRTIDTVGEMSVKEFSDASIDREFGEVTDGILFSVALQERVWNASTKGRGFYYFHESDIDEIVERFISKISSGDYLNGFCAYADSVVETHREKEASVRRIIDGADLLSETELTRVDQKLAEASEALGIEVLIRTTDSLYGRSAMVFADDAMDYEYGPVEDGVLFLISMEERDWYISTKGAGFETLDDDDIDVIVERFLSKISDGEYADGFCDYADSVVKTYRHETSMFHFDFISIGVPLVVALIIAFVVVSMLKSQLKSARFHNANQYLKAGSLVLTQNVDLFLYSNVTRTRIESSSSGGGGGHTSSSGSTHGGHGGKF